MDDESVIRSKDNRRLVYARSVRDGREHGSIFIEGKRQCIEAVNAGVQIELCILSESFDDSVVTEVIFASSPIVVRVADRLFAGIAETPSPQGILFIAKRPSTRRDDLEDDLENSTVPIVLYLCEINNPSNLGAILRTAEAAGIAGVIISEGSADAFSAKSNRAALGANLRLRIWDKVKGSEAIHFAEENGLKTAAAVVSDAVPYTLFDWKVPTMLMLGSEAHGLSDELANGADSRVTIPLENDVESLNLSVSTGILLFEAVRQARIS